MRRRGPLKMKKLSTIIFFLILSACTSEHNPARDKNRGSGSPEEKLNELRALIAAPETIDFAAVDRLVLKSACVSCHGGVKTQNGVKLTSFADVTATPNERNLVWAGSASDSIIYLTLIAPEGRRHMPPFGQPQLIEEQIKLVELWINHGAKNGPDRVDQLRDTREQAIQPYLDKPELIDYEAIRKLVFADSCLKCHSDTGAAPDNEAITLGADLTNYSTLFVSFNPAIKKGAPEESKVYKAVAISKIMPPKKRGYPELSLSQQNLLRLWILNCAVETKPAEDKLIENPENPEKVRDCI